MMTPRTRSKVIILLLVGCLTPTWVSADVDLRRMVVFGDSMSDPGNGFALTGQLTLPPYDDLSEANFLIPDRPYQRGGGRLSNGRTWIEQLATSLGLARDVRPAFRIRNALNFAVGGARARDRDPNETQFDLPEQVNVFLGSFGSSDFFDETLFVIAVGGNDIRDTILTQDPAILTDAINAIAASINQLYQLAGARKFLVVNGTDLGKTPALRILDNSLSLPPSSLPPGSVIAAATQVSALFNVFLQGALANLQITLSDPDLHIIQLDIFQALNNVVDNPESFGLTNAEDACIMPGIPPFQCQKAKNYFFWDGVHPTKAGHAILADQARTLLGYP